VFGKDMKNFALAAQSADAATHGFSGGLNDLTSSIPGVGSAVDALNERIHGMSFNQAKESMTGLDGALVNFMNTTKDYNKASALWQQMLLKSGLNTEQLAALLPNAYKQLGVMSAESMKAKDGLNGVAGAAKGVAGPTGKATAATKEYASAADAAAGAARGELGALSDLSKRMQAEVNPVFGLITAEQDLTKAQKDAAKAVKEHGRNSDQAKDATRKLALAAIDLQGKAGALSSSFDGKLSPSLIKTFKAAGLTDGQIKDVSKQFRQAKSDADKYDRQVQGQRHRDRRGRGEEVPGVAARRPGGAEEGHSRLGGAVGVQQELPRLLRGRLHRPGRQVRAGRRGARRRVRLQRGGHLEAGRLDARPDAEVGDDAGLRRRRGGHAVPGDWRRRPAFRRGPKR
jgi:hypothetical protein